MRTSGICHRSAVSFLIEANADFQVLGSETSACVPWMRRVRSSSETSCEGFEFLYVSRRDEIASERVEGFRPVIWMEWFPVFAKAWAMDRPMPRVPPVIRTWAGDEDVGVE